MRDIGHLSPGLQAYVRTRQSVCPCSLSTQQGLASGRMLACLDVVVSLSMQWEQGVYMAQEEGKLHE